MIWIADLPTPSFLKATSSTLSSSTLTTETKTSSTLTTETKTSSTSTPVPDIIYDSNRFATPPGKEESGIAVLDGSVGSTGFQARQVAELGDHIAFSGTARRLDSAVVTVVSWAYRSRENYSAYGDANSWSHPLTLNIYSVVNKTTIGTRLGTVTKTFDIPWRPEPNPVGCPGGQSDGFGFQWQLPGAAVNASCFGGRAMHATFDLRSLNLTVSDEIIWGLAFNTRNYGYSPMGVTGPYDSFNIATNGANASIGTDLFPAAHWTYRHLTGSEAYCDRGTAGIRVFRYDGECRGGSTPNIAFKAWKD